MVCPLAELLNTDTRNIPLHIIPGEIVAFCRTVWSICVKNHGVFGEDAAEHIHVAEDIPGVVPVSNMD